jgi:hypothetical protein
LRLRNVLHSSACAYQRGISLLLAHTLGGLVGATEPVLGIAPADAPLEVEALVSNLDVGFVRPDQSVDVKIAAYDYTVYLIQILRAQAVRLGSPNNRTLSGRIRATSLAKPELFSNSQ